ncbi:[Fe-Fe] hydrogenase large subunit C-terminal domain-containing protein [Thomasclavelia cocleata]|jgi:Na+-translocating ferredoxin:NAD+ oxidoreductase RNF subunit RnfB|uniref:Electron transport complex subunit RsxB n=1 Tax=Thomasclavelia cocleata TaxID=69824 RepID=A0A829Z6T3_9FIRM|nr:[Fe-Fe] hydrogenase large subunit C-terminal domain-containing protein [Thomasclavelia cocleata]MCI9131439.1 4Fe-4S binding protein [Thomasclavelia cocleata]MCI9630834.1 4Fe-4S binding protein [Thomasclavelia cocleata]GFI40073.1 electron transport complex subunit RsxB [Thomasclavelia cocleata]
MKPVISYLGNSCKKCIKCVKSCPTDAISIVNEQVIIDKDKCINCDICIQACDQKVLRVKHVDLQKALKKHDYNIALISTAILSDLKTYEEIKNIAHAIKKFGFDEVVQYSDIEGILYKQALRDSVGKHKVMLTSFCPTINKLIKNDYPTLIDHLLPYDYPVEIAAKKLKAKYKDKNIGIYSLCECVGKLTLAKKPFDNNESNIDYAFSISQMFPQINKLKDDQQENIEMNKYGVKSIVSDLYGNRDLSVISVEGLPQIKKALDLIEFDQLKHVDLIALFNCFQGCIGGYYLWSNPFEGCFNIKSMLSECQKDTAVLDKTEYQKIHTINSNEQNFKERLAWFNKVNAILETLPQFDCGSCGFANCRGLASRIASGEVDASLCRVKRR